MNRNVSTGLCVFMFVAATTVAQAKTGSHKSRQQDEQFLRTMAIDDMTEAHMGEMAHDKAVKGPVKDFGQTVASDETKDYEQLTVLANKTGERIPKGIDSRKSPAIRTLAEAKGGNFDREFLGDEIAGEQKIIATLQHEATHGTNPDVKAWAGKMVATRQEELQKAQALMKQA
jgi:putative membrane protein